MSLPPHSLELLGVSVAFAGIAGGLGWFLGRRSRNAEAESRVASSHAANEATAEFVAHVSHDIRVPMNGVVGMTNLMLESGLTPQQEELAKMLLDSAGHVINLTDQLLDLSKIEAGCLEIQEQPIELAVLLEELLKSHGARAAEKRLFLLYEIDPLLPEMVNADPLRLRQVLGNLLSNGIKFTDSGEVVLSVSSEKIDGRTMLRFTVRDTGIGIASEKQQQLFQAFKQADASIQLTYGGTGLGLTISRQLAELMGGRLEFSSEFGRGSTFTLLVPLKSVAEATPPRWLKKQKTFLGMRALLVSGTSSGLVAYASWLESWGFSVARFGAMEEAVGWIRDGGEADLALVDLDVGVGFADLRKHFLQRSPAGNWIAFAFKPPAGAKDRILLKPLLPLSLLEHLLASFSNPEISEKSAIAASVSKEPEKTLSEGRRAEVLVADDDAVNLRVIRSYLENLGCRVTLARDGFEVLELVKHRSFDALFLDVMMPRKDGTEVLREIRTEESLTSGKRMLVIAVTARAAPSDRKAGLAAGFDEYITKPLSAVRIREALQKFGLIAIADATEPSENRVWADEDAVVLDLTRLHQLASSNVANMAEIVTLYFERVVELFPKLQSALARRDSEESYRLAHTLAGASATAGMGLAAMAFQRVEAASKANEFSQAASEVAAIPHTIARSAEVAARKLPLKKTLPRL